VQFLAQGDRTPTAEAVDAFLFALSCKGCKANTLNRHLAGLKSYFKFLGQPLNIESYHLPSKLRVWLTNEDKERYEAAAVTPFEKAIIRVFLGTGIRLGELCGLQRSDLTTEARGGGYLRVTGKGSIESIVTVNERTLTVIQDYLQTRTDTDARMFPRSRVVISQVVSGIGRRCGLRVTPHLLRHTFAGQWLAKGGKLHHLQGQLRHKSLATTSIYVHSVPTERLEEMPDTI